MKLLFSRQLGALLFCALQKPYEESVLRRWMAQLLLALDYLEHVNVLHVSENIGWAKKLL